MANIKEAKDKIDRVLVNWFNDDPMMLGVWCLVDKIEDKNQDTIGIDTKVSPPIIKFNPNFVNALHSEHLEAVMASEGLKLLLRHPTTRLLNPKHISSLSSSITINQMIASPGFEDLEDMYPLPERYGLKSKQFFEEYFRNLMDKKTDVEQQIQDTWNSMSDDEKNEAMENAVKGQSDKSEGSEDGEGEGEGSDGKDSDGFKEFDGKNDALAEYYNPNGSSNDGWGANELFDADVKNMVADNKGSMKNWGSHTADILAEIIAANEPKISWKDIVRRFNNSVMDVQTLTSRMKVNRRYDLLSPGTRRKYRCKIAFFVDISGSMSDKVLQEGFAVINSVCKHAEITYATFDTEIKQIETKFKKAKNFKLHGRGGTEVNPVIDWIDEHKYDGLVIFSDMYFSSPREPKNTKVLWLCTAKDQHPPVDWGFVAKLDMYESHY